jgi:hypothetical protein
LNIEGLFDMTKIDQIDARVNIPAPPATVAAWWAHTEDEGGSPVTAMPNPPTARDSAEANRERILAAASGEKLIVDDPFFGEALNIFEARRPPGFDGSEFPIELAQYPLLESQRTGFDATILLLSTLGVAAAAIPDQIQITTYYGSNWFQQPRLFTLLLGVSGASKSPAYKIPLKALVDIQTAATRQWQRELAALPKDTPAEEKPTRPVIVINDTTVEALAKALADNERGVLITTDEFSAFFGSMDAYKSGGAGGKDRAEYLRLYDGGFNSILRAKDGGSVTVPNWGASILSCTTPAALGKIAKHLYDDGFMQRFNVFYVQSRRIVHASEISSDRRQATETAAIAYARLLQALFGLTVDAHNGVCTLSPEALLLFDRWRSSNKLDQDAYEGMHPGLASHYGKGPNFLLRVALVFHCVDTIAHSTSGLDPAKRPVSVDTLALAIAWLEKAFKHSAAFYLGDLAASPVLELAQRIARYVLAQGPQKLLARRNLTRDIPAFRKAEDGPAGSREAALRSLEEAGWLIPDLEAGYLKRHATQWAINPTVWQKFDDIARAERERVASAKERMADDFEERRQEKLRGEED